MSSPVFIVARMNRFVFYVNCINTGRNFVEGYEIIFTPLFLCICYVIIYSQGEKEFFQNKTTE